MSFFGRAANLLKGGIRSLGSKDPDSDAYARALEEELRRDQEAGRVTPRAGAAPRREPQPAAPRVEERGPPEKDAAGEVKRTL